MTNAVWLKVVPEAATQAGIWANISGLPETFPHFPGWGARGSSPLPHLLGLLLGEMVTSLRMTLGDCCRGGVRQGLSSTSGWDVSSSPTRTRSRLPSSMPFPNHRPHGNLKVRQRPVREASSSSVLPLAALQEPSTKPIPADPQGPAHPSHRVSSGNTPE